MLQYVETCRLKVQLSPGSQLHHLTGDPELRETLAVNKPWLESISQILQYNRVWTKKYTKCTETRSGPAWDVYEVTQGNASPFCKLPPPPLSGGSSETSYGHSGSGERALENPVLHESLQGAQGIWCVHSLPWIHPQDRRGHCSNWTPGLVAVCVPSYLSICVPQTPHLWVMAKWWLWNCTC